MEYTIIPAEPIIKPEPKPSVIPRPDQDDPFYFPIPKIDPSPLG